MDLGLGVLVLLWPVFVLLALLAGVLWLGKRLLRATVRVVWEEWQAAPPPQVRTGVELHRTAPRLFFVAGEPQRLLPDARPDAGMGQPQRSQNAQPDAKAEPDGEHAPRALARHRLRFLDDRMRLGPFIGGEEGHQPRDVVCLTCAATGGVA